MKDSLVPIMSINQIINAKYHIIISIESNIQENENKENKRIETWDLMSDTCLDDKAVPRFIEKLIEKVLISYELNSCLYFKNNFLQFKENFNNLKSTHNLSVFVNSYNMSYQELLKIGVNDKLHLNFDSLQ